MANLKKSEKISILRGGISDERQISIFTANQVFETLKKKYRTTIIDVSDNCLEFIDNLIKSKPDKVFNCLHGFFGEDGQIQSILNYLKIPYTHSGVLASSISMNKKISKEFFKSLDVKYPETINLNKILKKKDFPIIAKPICGGSSNGLLKINDENEMNILKKKNNELEKFIFEEFIDGREITVGILDDKVCGIMEIVFDSELYDFKNKYVDIAKHVINPILPKLVNEKIKETSIKVHKSLGCICLSRLDFRYNNDTNEFYLLEINTQPGLTKDSLLPEMANKSGINFLDLCEIILSNAKCEV